MNYNLVKTRGFIKEWKWRKLKSYLANIKLVVFDVDGVLTDGGLWLDSNNNLLKRFNVRDGVGIRMLQNSNIDIAFLSGGLGGSTEHRAKQLDIKYCFTGVKNKLIALEELKKQTNYNSENITYVGDDLNDLPVRDQVKLLFATCDACENLKREADIVLDSSGGQGVARELSERILWSRKELNHYQLKGYTERNI